MIQTFHTETPVLQEGATSLGISSVSTYLRLVRALKVLRRWTSDGASLRLLNKHWSEAINQNISNICPHKNRLLVPLDLVPLRKFSHLTSVDITLFVASRKSAKQQSTSVPSNAKWYTATN